MAVLKVSNLSKSFGTQLVLDRLNMEVAEHSIYGFVGKNGAGKTTTMKIALGLLKADKGEVTVCGKKVRYGETATNKLIGYLPDVPEFYDYMRPFEYLKLCGEICGLSGDKIKKRSVELLSLVGLNDTRKKIGSYSRGMKQRLGIAQALLGEPRLLICDEPTSALDPIGRREILDILLKLKGKTTIIFSTHILSDVEQICDYIALLDLGNLKLFGTIDEIRKKHRTMGYEIIFRDTKEAGEIERLLREQIDAKSNTEELDRNNGRHMIPHLFTSIQAEERKLSIYVNDEREAGRYLLTLMSTLDIIPEHFGVIEPTLEHLFMDTVHSA